jgi:hypothetical protein
MPSTWHDINAPGFFSLPPQEPVSGTAATDTVMPGEKKKKNEPEVRLKMAKWKAGEDGFQFNKKVFLEISAEFIKNTNRKKLTLKTFVIFNGQKEDILHDVEAFLDDTGAATATITLFYGERFYEALKNDPASKCQYKCEIKHPLGEKEIESELLDMPTEPAAAVSIIGASFVKDTLSCGDSVELRAQTENVADEREILFEVKNVADKSAVATIKTKVTNGKSSALWVCQKQTDDWNDTSEQMFSVIAEKTSKDSSNTFKFHKYPDYNAETKTVNCASGIFGWIGKYHVRLADRIVYIGIKIRLVNRLGIKPAAGGALPPIGPAVSDVDKQAIKKDIESKLSRKWVFHRKSCQRKKECNCDSTRGCCKFPVKIQVFFVESGEDHVVDLFQGAGRANSAQWTRVKTRNNSWAHETGHLLGWYDEYVGGAVGAGVRWKAPRAGAIMETGLSVPREYYQDFMDWVASKTSEPWKCVAK